MKKQRVPMLIYITMGFVLFTLGYFLGMGRSSAPVQYTISPSMQTFPLLTESTEAETTLPQPTISFPIHINRADKEEFQALPGIGDVLAQRIVDYRAEHGSFSALEDLMNVEGIGKKRFEMILDLITLGG